MGELAPSQAALLLFCTLLGSVNFGKFVKSMLSRTDALLNTSLARYFVPICVPEKCDPAPRECVFLDEPWYFQQMLEECARCYLPPTNEALRDEQACARSATLFNSS